MKKVLSLCIILSLILVITACSGNAPVTSLNINSGTIRLESDMSKVLTVTATPETASQSAYELISENELVAICDENSVSAVSEGETYIYAASKDGKVISNKVKVIVNNEIFEVAAKIIATSESDTSEDFSKVSVTTKSISQITQTEVETVPEIFTDSNSDETVYITKSGSKYHKSTCSYSKDAVAVSKSEAISKNKHPCKKCNP